MLYDEREPAQGLRAVHPVGADDLVSSAMPREGRASACRMPSCLLDRSVAVPAVTY